MRTIYTALFSLLVTSASFADEVGVHIASWHDKSGYNNFNPGIYYKFDSGQTLGIYQNSVSRTSVYFGHTFEHRDLSLTVGGVVGYVGLDVNFLVVPAVKIHNFRLAIIPKFGKINQTTTFHITQGFKF